MSTNSAVRDRKLRRATPDTSAPITSRSPSASSEPSNRVLAAANSTGICTCGTTTRVSVSERSGVEITVLGKSPAWQDTGGACSGYLVRDGDFVLLLDCGNGVFGKLRE